MTMTSQLKYKFQNNNSSQVTVIVEPSAEEYDVPSESVLSMDIFYDRPGLLETEINPNYFVIWLWAGCRANVRLDDKDLPTGDLTVPAFG